MSDLNNPVATLCGGSPDPAVMKSWLGWVLTIGGKKAPAVTALMVGALVVFSVGLAVLWIGHGIPLYKILLMAVAGLVIGLIAVLVTKAVARRRAALLGDVVAWALAGAFALVIALTISVVFFGVPRAGRIFVGEVIDAPSFASSMPESTKTISSSMRLTAVDPIFRRPPHGSDMVERVADLGKFPALSIQGATLSAEPGENLYIAANTLRLEDTTIVTNGGSVTIEVLRLYSTNSRIRSFETNASSHGDGASGGLVTLIVHDQTGGSRLAVDLSGQSGAIGDPGAAGSTGAAGAAGENAASGAFDCRRGAGNGSSGQKGGTGGDGGAGGKGGNGGTLILAGRIDPSRVEFRSDGGAGGAGGPGGSGGAGGPGGPGGSARGLCSGGGNSGPQGPQGGSGPNGANGANGYPGELIVKKIAEAI